MERPHRKAFAPSDASSIEVKGCDNRDYSDFKGHSELVSRDTDIGKIIYLPLAPICDIGKRKGMDQVMFPLSRRI